MTTLRNPSVGRAPAAVERPELAARLVPVAPRRVAVGAGPVAADVVQRMPALAARRAELRPLPEARRAADAERHRRGKPLVEERQAVQQQAEAPLLRQHRIRWRPRGTRCSSSVPKAKCS
jgi:hypothetical protein